MPIKKKTARKTPRPAPLRPSEILLLETGQEDDFHVFFLSYEDNARELFERVRGDYPPGSFPWAEQRFGREG
jgi:hypothetical protein